MPHSVEIERAFLSALLCGAPFEDAEGLRPGDFYRTDHQLVFESMQVLNKARQPIDLTSVVEKLRSAGQIKKIGSIAAVSALLDFPVTCSLPHAVDTIRDYADKRKIITECSRLTGKAFDCPDVAELLSDAQASILSIGERQNTAVPEPLEVVYSGLVDDLDAIQTGKHSSGLQTGFSKLDPATGGLQSGELIILAARPSMGKTALALNIAENCAYDEKSVLFFSLEQPKKQLALRSLSRTTGISLSALRYGNISPVEWERIIKAQEKIQGLPLLIDDRAGLHVQEIKSTCRRLAKDRGLDLVVVDYLQLCRGDRAERKDLEVGQISAGLKALAKELNVPVLALSQLSREVERRNDKRPQLSDLRESGALEQDADVVMFLYNPNHYTRDIPEHQQTVEVEVLIEKNRQGQTGFFKLLWRAWLTSFSDAG